MDDNGRIAPAIGQPGRKQWSPPPLFRPAGPVGLLLQSLALVGMQLDEQLQIHLGRGVTLHMLLTPLQLLRL